MNEWRKQIDDINFELLELIAKRFEVVMQISEIKKQRGLPPEDSQRIRYMLDRLEMVWQSYPIAREVTWERAKPVFVSLFNCSMRQIAEVAE